MGAQAGSDSFFAGAMHVDIDITKHVEQLEIGRYRRFETSISMESARHMHNARDDSIGFDVK